MLHGKSAAVWLCAALAAASHAKFSDRERDQILSYWNAKGRYEVSTPKGQDAWQVRLTPEGSQWLWDYNKARGIGKIPPGSIPAPRTAEEAAWEKWIDAKVAYDRAIAQSICNERNGKMTLASRPVAPPEAPISLRNLLYPAPMFAAAVQPKTHTITFDDGMVLSLTDNADMRPRYAYYRSSEGVMSGGIPVKSIPQPELDKLFDLAGVDKAAQKVMRSVSVLEGGFDSVNTYDTGFVSVGLIQFACLKEGGGSLGAVLYNEKTSNPAAFDRDFRKFGIDVSDEKLLIALDLQTGSELLGPQAAAQIIKEKRLIAVFQRAGRISTEFKVAQLRTAYEQYYPGNDVVTVLLGYQPLTGRVGDIIKSEAGLATLMDRKVNTGKLEPLVSVLAQIAQQNSLTDFKDFATFEGDVVAALRYRVDYTKDATLTQPALRQHPNRSYLPSRHQPRSTKKGGKGK